MTLKIQLKKGQKVIVNGAVLENLGSHTASIGVRNDAAVLRDRDILTPEDAVTPASRAYYALQCLYLFPDEAAKYGQLFASLSDSYASAAKSAAPLVQEIKDLVANGRLYNALKEAQKLIAHEGSILNNAAQEFGERVRDTETD